MINIFKMHTKLKISSYKKVNKFLNPQNITNDSMQSMIPEITNLSSLYCNEYRYFIKNLKISQM